jgi:hypothetical protein
MVWEDQDKERGRGISNLAWDVTTPLVFNMIPLVFAVK